MKRILGLFVSIAMLMSMFTLTYAKPTSDITKVENHLKANYGVQNLSDEFQVVSNTKDNLGYRHILLQQTVKGIPVYGGEYAVHLDKKGEVYFENGNIDKELRNQAKELTRDVAFISEDEAIEAAKIDVNYTKPEATESNVKLRDDKIVVENDEASDEILESKMFMYNIDGNYVPVYLVRLGWTRPDSIHDWRIFVSAEDGSIVDKYDAVAFGTGTGVLGDTKTINTTKSGSTYTMVDGTRNIRTYDCRNGTSIPGTLMSDADDRWTSTTQRAGVDAHYYAGVTYDYYKNKHGRNSINGSGMQIKSSVHYSSRYNNAGWTGSQMIYGDGDGTTFTALSGGLDVIAHELTHGVIQYTCNLEYRNQPGALNESIADIMGVCAEFYGQPSKADWLMGEDIYTPGVSGDALRSLSNPTLYDQPAHMDDYINTTSDNGGVHYNSGIPNRAAYLIGSSIGVAKLEKIVYRAMTVRYLNTTSNFAAFRSAILRATTDLYGSSGTEYTTAVNAFNSVGI